MEPGSHIISEQHTDGRQQQPNDIQKKRTRAKATLMT